MATRCTGNRCHYGYGHTREHEEAARKGWRTRRYGEAKYLSTAFHGYEVHTHRGGKVILRDTSDDSTFELSRREADEVIRQVRSDERLKHKEQRAKERASARADRDVRYEREQNDRIAARVERELFNNAISEVVGYGGIRNYKKDANGQRISQEDVWSQIPRYYRARADNQRAKTADEVASELAENFPYLGIQSDSDLAQAFASRRFKRNEKRSAPKGVAA